MQKLLTFVLLIFIGSLCKLQAAHIIGGEVTYTCISSNPVTKRTTFRIKYTLYRDVLGGGALFDQNAEFGLYSQGESPEDWQHRQTLTANIRNLSLVSLNDPCVVVPSNVRVEKGNYEFDVTIPWDDKTYMITYQRCCRNNTISNIHDPSDAGAVYSIELSPAAIENCNNSPVFKFFPPTVICNNRPLMFDHGATDVEGDSLVFEFCVPLTSGGQDPGNGCNGIIPSSILCPPPYANVEYTANYTFDTPMAANPQISVHPESGLMTGKPFLTGQFVIGVCMKEYRNGVLYTITRRDFQFNVVNCTGVTFNQEITLCENDSIVINDITYTESGIFTQNFISSSGCDSILVLSIKQDPASEELRDVSICSSETYVFEGQSLTTSGTYTKILTNQFGCDSIITLRLLVLSPGSDTLRFSICDEEFLEINDEIYNTSGIFLQKLTASNGCDSLLTIVVNKGISTQTTRNIYLCLESNVEINGIIYNTPGTFEQNFETDSGCDSLLVIKVFPCDENLLYDFQLCNALTPEQSMIYGEFIPTYTSQLSCGTISASNIYRDMPQIFKHSCSAGHESTLSMCVSASTSCEPQAIDQKPVLLTFLIDAEEGSYLKWNHFVFHHNSPANYAWISGPSGLNNGPTKFLMKIYKNGFLLKEDIYSTTNGWTKEQVNFFEDPTYLFADKDSISIEWWPYCAVGNAGSVSVWDLDNIALFFSCETVENRVIAGSITNFSSLEKNVTIKRYQDYKVVTAEVKDGGFVFLKNDPFVYYRYKGELNAPAGEGISGIDLVLVQQHILGLRPFDNPLQFIAADVNRDGRVNSLDLVDIRKVILGLREYFPNNSNWRFIPLKALNDNSNPFSWEDWITVEPGYHDIMNLDLIPVKTGDIDGLPDMPVINTSTRRQ